MSPPWPASPPGERERRAYRDAAPRPFWLDSPSAPAALPPLEGDREADLVVVGAGFTGLWAALQAKEDDPDRAVVVLEAETAAFGASGRNGGFVDASLTHGLANGLARFPDEMPALERLGRENLDGLAATVARHGIECDLRLDGEYTVALEPHEVGWLDEEAESLERFGHEVELLDGAAMRGRVHSPLYLGGLKVATSAGTVDPARLAWGLRRAALDLGVEIFERTPVRDLRPRGAGIEARADGGRVIARRAAIATSAYPPLARAIRRYVVPVYDYVLVSEPLGERWDAVGWEDRVGIGDSANRFHYYRPTADGRILFGGYDAIYHFRGRVDPALDQRDATFGLLAQHFFATFPQLEGTRFSHRWGGAIDTCSRFSVFFGTTCRGRAAYAVGYTGLGVAASRFGARVALDLADGRDTEATRLRYVRRRPVPFPPEPLRWAVIELTRNRLAAADRSAGRRGLWLRTLDRLGLGFDS